MTFDRAKIILLRKTVSVLQGRLREGVPLIFLAFAPPAQDRKYRERQKTSPRTLAFLCNTVILLSDITRN